MLTISPGFKSASSARGVPDPPEVATIPNSANALENIATAAGLAPEIAIGDAISIKNALCDETPLPPGPRGI